MCIAARLLSHRPHRRTIYASTCNCGHVVSILSLYLASVNVSKFEMGDVQRYNVQHYNAGDVQDYNV